MQTALTTAAPTQTVPWIGGRGTIDAHGTWGGGTITLTYAETAGDTFVPIGTGVTLSADGSTGFEIRGGYLQATLSGSTGASLSWGYAETKRI